MKIRYFLIASAFMLSLGAGCSSNQYNNTVQPTVTGQNTSPQPAQVQPAPAQTAPVAVPAPKPIESKKIFVTIQNFSFQPSDINAQKGDSVIFNNQDPVTHTITSQTFDSGPIPSGQSFVLDTSKLSPASYDFHCSIHPSMTGTITVK